MTESNIISLFEEEEKSCEMDNKEKSFETFEDYKGYIFTRRDIEELGYKESKKFDLGLKLKQIKFIAGTYKKISKGKSVERIVNKKRLIALGLDVGDKYYQFVKGWRHPDDVELDKFMKQRRHEHYWEIRVYADTIDRRVDEANKVKERKRINKINYELDDNRGWVTVDERDLAKKAKKTNKDAWE